MNQPKLFILSVAAVLAAAPLHAEVVMLDPAFVSCTLPLLPGGVTSYQNVVNQSGLSSTYVSQTTTFDSYIATNPTSGLPATNFTVVVGTQPVYVFDLGVKADVSKVILWNSISGALNRVSNFTVKVSNSLDFSAATNAGTFSLNTSNPAYPVSAEVFTTTPATGRYVQVTFNNATGANTTFGEIAFAGTVVPEASSAALAGLGALLLVRRRRAA